MARNQTIASFFRHNKILTLPLANLSYGGRQIDAMLIRGPAAGPLLSFISKFVVLMQCPQRHILPQARCCGSASHLH